MGKRTIEHSVAGRSVQITGRVLKTARLRSEYYIRLDDASSFVHQVRESGLRADILTFMQPVDDTVPKYSFHHEPEKIAVLPITTYDDWFGKQLYNKPRNTLRKALKSRVEIRLEEFSDDLLHGIKDIYDESPVRQGRRNRHYRKDLETIRKEHATFLDRSQFITAYFADEMIGFAKVTFSQGFANVMNFLSKLSHRDKAPNNALLAKAVEICAARKVKWLVYGVWGSGGAAGLVDFKTANGFQCVEVPRYYVPLSSLGRLALKAGVQGGIVSRIPSGCVEAAANVRKRWNSLRFRSLPT